MLLDSRKGGNVTWTCGAIDHGVTVFPHGKVGPCCQISADYLKPISELNNPARFADLKIEMSSTHPCNKCSVAENNGMQSYRDMFKGLTTQAPGIQFLDIRNTNFCNLKCRYCGPHFSSQWAEELHKFPIIQKQDITKYKDMLITDSLSWLYFTGGEPLINAEHWQMLEELIDSNRSHKIALNYNSNLTTIKFKDKNIIDIWKNFKDVNIQCSIDAIGLPLEYIRSGASWEKIKSNIEEILIATKNSQIKINFSPVVSILNIWFIDKLYEYAKTIGVPVLPIVLVGPDYLALDATPDSLKYTALTQVSKLQDEYKVDKGIIQTLQRMISNNNNQNLFERTIAHVLLLDHKRGEALFDLLPFNIPAIEKILKNYEYE
jgi:molybdenum cofactor biosynthesis enzyme MoaA